MLSLQGKSVLDCFEHVGVKGLADGKATGAKAKFTPEIEAFLHSKLGEDRVWNSTLLGEAIEQAFGDQARSDSGQAAGARVRVETHPLRPG